MENLAISPEGTYTLPGQGDVVAFTRYLEDHGVRCDAPGTTFGGADHGPILQGHIRKPFDAERVQAIYREWVSKRTGHPGA